MTRSDRLSDPALRTLAWVATCFLPAGVVVGLPISLAEDPSSVSWGGGLAGDLSFLLVVLSFPLAGLLILRKQPRNTIGWLLELVGLLWGLTVAMDDYTTYGLVVNPGALPGADFVAGAGAGNWAPGIGVMGTFLVLLYPDGHLPSRRWRPVAWASAVSIVVVTVTLALGPGKLDNSPVPTMENPLGWQAAEPVLHVLLAIFLPLLPLSMAACAVALVLRFRRSSGVERLQLKWLATAGAVVAALYLAAMAGSLAAAVVPYASADGSWWLALLQTGSILSFVLIPASIGIAVLRHGLYGIDMVINRTLVYGSLTVTLAAVYIGCVLVLQVVLAPFTRSSDLAVAASTLAVAALFGPARRRFQSIVDRRFYRSRYDAAWTLAAFTSRLRHEVDLDAVAADLRSTVKETVQPAHLSLWIRS